MKFFIKKRIIYLIFTLFISFSLISAEIITADDHDCIGKKCFICLHIYAYKNIVKITTGVFIDSIQQLQYNEKKSREIIISFFLIDQKVRLNT